MFLSKFAECDFDTLFWHKMNERVITFLLAGDKFMPKMHLRQPCLTYSACRSFSKNKEYKTLK